MTTVRLVDIGGSTGVALPNEVLDWLQVKESDTLYVVTTRDGIALIPNNPLHSIQMEFTERVMNEDRDA